MLKDNSRSIERLFYDNSIIDEDLFPPLSSIETEIQTMESLVFDYNNQSLCYTYIRNSETGWFVDIYYYYELLSAHLINKKRFLIAPGYQMSEKDENDFMDVVHCDEVLFNNRVCDDYIKEIAEVAPEINMRAYNNIGIALYHTYFASFRGGIREQLVKAGFVFISMHLHMIEGWNIISHNIEGAFGIPIKLLRKLNTHECVETVLATEEGRKRALMVYRRYHHIMNDMDIINEFQIRYLSECLEKSKEPDKKLLVELQPLESGWNEEEEEYYDGYHIYEQVMRYR